MPYYVDRNGANKLPYGFITRVNNTIATINNIPTYIRDLNKLSSYKRIMLSISITLLLIRVYTFYMSNKNDH